jgi:hypothetical protein
LEAFKSLDIGVRSRSPELYAVGPDRFEDDLAWPASQCRSFRDTLKVVKYSQGHSEGGEVQSGII